MRRRFQFHGHVQGVGFRYTTRQIARRFPVTGYVRNLPDGTVELVVEGDEDVVTQMHSAVESRFEGHISRTDDEEYNTSEQFSSFDIRR